MSNNEKDSANSHPTPETPLVPEPMREGAMEQKRPPALKHGVYARSALFAGEDGDAYIQMRQEVFDDLQPQGPLQKETCESLVKNLWRKANLNIFDLPPPPPDNSMYPGGISPMIKFINDIEYGKDYIPPQSETRSVAVFSVNTPTDAPTRREYETTLRLEDMLDVRIDRDVKRLAQLRMMAELNGGPKAINGTTTSGSTVSISKIEEDTSKT